MIERTSNELEFALDIARQAGGIALRYFNEGIQSSMKPDNTPLTRADTECERMIREAINRHFPHDGILGEEEGETPGAVPAGSAGFRRWIIDPVDGTYNFARKVPVFSTLLALEQDGDVRIGVLFAPALDELYCAERGRGAFRNGKRIKVSNISDLSQSMFEFGAPARIIEEGLWERFGRIVSSTYRQRGFGDYMGFAHVIDGRAEAHLEVGVKIWDVAPMKVLVEEAGGRYTDLAGGSDIAAGSCLVSNGLVHDAIMQLLTD